MKRFLSIVVGLYLLDQITKLAILRWLPLHGEWPVIPGLFNLVHVRNTGAAFGMLKDNNAFFIILATAVLIGMLWFHKAILRQVWHQQIAFALLTAGILGNLTDRIWHGAVIDFLDFYMGEAHWPAFNVADSCICVAAGLFILDAFLSKPDKKPGS